MKHKLKIFIIGLLLITACLKAQNNLVLNPSFEGLRNCPNDGDEADSALNWNWISSLIPTNGACKGELFTPCCSNPTYCSSPYNGVGFQKARTGNSYIGLQTTYFCPIPINNYRDYLKGQLSSALQTGKNYCLTFYYNASDRLTYATNRFGAYLDDGAISSYNCCKDIPVTPQVQNNPAIFMSDTMNWVKIQGSFTAIGNENTITLGNFVDSATIQFQLFNSNGTINPYYLIDDVSLLPMDLPAYAGHDTSIAQNDSAYIGRTSEVGLDDDCIWYVLGNATAIDTIAGKWVKPSTTTSYAVEQNICGTVTYDTVIVNVSPLGINKLSANDKQINVYPNPSSGELYISSNDLSNKDLKVEITDIAGRIVLQNSYAVNNGLVKINTQLTNGVYFIRVVNSTGEIQIQKIIFNN